MCRECFLCYPHTLGTVESTKHVYLQMTRELLQEANRCFERYAFAEVHNG